MTYKNGQLSGEGSGIIWGEDSTGTYTYIVTCAHVIDQTGVTFGVLLLDGKTYEAEMVATDTRTDIGVLKIKATGLPLAEVGDSSSLKVGEPIYAIGNPGGSEYFGSITDGIVSAIDRSVSATYTMTCIQHNAAINPGNSGGALVNTAGQIVGINSSKIASTEFEGMGFAVPTSIAQSVVESLIKFGYVPNRPKLGIQYAEVSAYQLYSMVVSIKGLPQGSLVIAGISQDSALANTKAEVGDLIIAVNGKDMDDSSVLLDLIDTGAVGDSITLTLCRIEQRTYKTTTFDVKVTLIEDKGDAEEEQTTTAPSYDGGYYYGGAGSFEDFFNDYFGFGW
jgi:serine protease Do